MVRLTHATCTIVGVALLSLLLSACNSPTTTTDVSNSTATIGINPTPTAVVLVTSPSPTDVASTPTEASTVGPIKTADSPVATSTIATTAQPTPHASATARARTPTPSATKAPAATATPVPSRTSSPTATPTTTPTAVPLTPTPLQLQTVAFPGIPNIYLDHPDYNAGVTGYVWFRVEANDDLAAGAVNGKDISSVEFQIQDNQGNVVHDQLEKNAAYCPFGGDNPNCPSWVFSAHGNKWPKGQTVQNGGQYTLTVTATSSQGSNTQSFAFVVKL
jgi:hypothetical protein